ncbi:MAG: menaquinone biosynthetic enzyme MqnA/MqnD family protein [Acidobacteriota bacterium]
MPKVRVGIVNYLNAKPLAWGFLKGHHSDLLSPRFHPPARVAELLRAGEIDVGLIPSIEVQRIPGLRVLPDLCIAATSEVRSVLLVSRVPVPEIRRVALDENSRTSAALVRILLSDGYGLEPEYHQARADLPEMLEDADAALLIGDPALRVDRERYLVLDFAAEWRRLTGLPFVFAVWAVRPEVELPELPFYFKSSLRFGLTVFDNLVEETSAALGLDPGLVRSYLRDNLSYFLRAEELRGLAEFYRRAHRLHLIGTPQPLTFWEMSETSSR